MRLVSKPKDFRFEELERVLLQLGYAEDTRGKTSGSRVAFIHRQDKHIIRLHKPHPGNELKRYQLDQVVAELKSRRMI
ncbi:MAG TPA: type II toxin-antitoxin system HicA family toxin [Rectinemataceae bacterium]